MDATEFVSMLRANKNNSLHAEIIQWWTLTYNAAKLCSSKIQRQPNKEVVLGRKTRTRI